MGYMDGICNLILICISRKKFPRIPCNFSKIHENNFSKNICSHKLTKLNSRKISLNSYSGNEILAKCVTSKIPIFCPVSKIQPYFCVENFVIISFSDWPLLHGHLKI